MLRRRKSVLILPLWTRGPLDDTPTHRNHVDLLFIRPISQSAAGSIYFERTRKGRGYSMLRRRKSVLILPLWTRGPLDDTPTHRNHVDLLFIRPISQSAAGSIYFERTRKGRGYSALGRRKSVLISPLWTRGYLHDTPTHRNPVALEWHKSQFGRQAPLFIRPISQSVSKEKPSSIQGGYYTTKTN